MFNIEERTLMSFYRTDSKSNLLADLKAAAPFIDDEEAAAMATDIIKRLENTSDEDFKKINFREVLDNTVME
jgi:hypothetical protein